MFKGAFLRLTSNLFTVLVPLVWNLGIAVVGLMVYGFQGEPLLDMKLVLDVGMPVIGSILAHDLLPGLNLFGAGTSLGTVIIVLSMLVAGAFLNAGYIGLLYRLTRGSSESPLVAFLACGIKYWPRMLLVDVIVFIVSLVMIFFALAFGILGFYLMAVAMIILRWLYIYLEFTIIAEDVGVAEALLRCREHSRRQTPDTLNAIVAILAANAFLALIINLLWTPLVLMIGICIFAVVATWLQLALMDSFVQILDGATTDGR